jgi:hypothetical protein
MIKQLVLCDLCNKEDDHKAYWANRHGSNIILNFKNCPSITNELTYEHLCKTCYSKIYQAITKSLGAIKTELLLYNEVVSEK